VGEDLAEEVLGAMEVGLLKKVSGVPVSTI
jgi:hypothetical protein